MTKLEKQEFVKQWNAELQDVQHGILVDYRGLTVAQATELRGKIRETGSDYRVVKNTLARLATDETPLAPLKEHFVGPLAMATNKAEPVALAKALVDFAKSNEALQIKVAVVDGQLLEPAEITELSKLPSRDELLAKLLYVLNAPVQGFATALNAITRDLAIVLNQVADKKE